MNPSNFPFPVLCDYANVYSPYEIRATMTFQFSVQFNRRIIADEGFFEK